MLVRKRVLTQTENFAIKPVYQDDRFAQVPEHKTEELVLTVYGGDTETSDKILAQTEVLTFMKKTDGGADFFGPSGLKLDRYEFQATGGELYVTRIACSTPRALHWIRPEVNMGAPLPVRLRPGDTVTVIFPEKLLSLS